MANPFPTPLTYNASNGNEEKLKIHREYLKSIESEENNRLTLIESKTTQMVSQTGIIFALLSLFIPLVIDKIDVFPLKVLLLVVLGVTFLFYLLTIHNAAKNFNVRNFVYVRSTPASVVTHQDKTPTQFLEMEINDLLSSTRRNTETNNIKADNLISSYNCFKIANFLTAFLGALLCFSLFYIGQKKECLTIESPIRIEANSPSNK